MSNVTYLQAVALALAIGSIPALAQDATTVTFEEYALPVDSFANGATLRANGEFDLGSPESNGLALRHSFTEFNGAFFWSDWAISNTTDTTDGTFLNDVSAFTGQGVDGSDNYAVAFGNTRMFENSLAQPIAYVFEEIYVTNTTYAALVIRDGNQFSDRFGGVTGTDPDFFTVTFRGYLNGRASADSVTVYLADFRSDDPADDYILDEWLAVDLTSLGQVTEVKLRFASSDVNAFGILTPTYVAVDDIRFRAEEPVGLRDLEAAPAPWVFPSVAKEVLYVETEAPVAYAVYDMLGRETLAGTTSREIDVADLRPGAYAIRFRDSGTGAWTAAARFQRVD